MWVRFYLVWVVGFAVLVPAIGCSGKDLGQYATVSGTVSHNGNPVDGAKVEFHGTTESAGAARNLFSAYTDSNGKYMIAGVGSNPGIAPGVYKVAISKYEGGVKPGENYDPGQIDAMISDSQGGKGVALKNLLPTKYASPASSKLSVTVESGKNENVNFDLTNK